MNGNIDSNFGATISLPLKAHLPLEIKDDLQSESHQAVENFFNDIGRQMQKCKEELYKLPKSIG